MKMINKLSLFSAALFLFTSCTNLDTELPIKQNDIIYFDDDGSILKTIHDPDSYTPSSKEIETPTKPNDLKNGYQFSFRCWDRVPNQDGHICFKAVYDVCSLGVEFEIAEAGAYVKEYKGNNRYLILPDYWEAKPVIGIKAETSNHARSPKSCFQKT